VKLPTFHKSFSRFYVVMCVQAGRYYYSEFHLMYLFVTILLMPVLAVRYLIYTSRIKAKKKPFS